MSTNEKLVVYMTPDSQEFALQLARRELKRVEAKAAKWQRMGNVGGELDRLAAEASDLEWLIKDLESAVGEVV